jgi:hypothetical protein
MFFWPIDNAFFLYVIAAALAAGLLAAWWTTRKRGYLIAVGTVAGIAGLLFVLTLLVETDRKQIVRALQEMMDGVKEKNLDKTFRHITSDCTTHFANGQWDRQTLLGKAKSAIKDGGVEEINLWGFDFEQVDSPRALVFFNAKPFGKWSSGAEYCGCRAEFRLEGGRWRMSKLVLFKPGTNERLVVPI